MSSFFHRMYTSVSSIFTMPLLPRMSVRLILLGLDAAGKTTILYKINQNNSHEIVTTIPTIGFNVETLELDTTLFTCWDVGGCGKIRSLWRHYIDGSHAIVFVVDSTDRERIEEASDELKLFVNNDTAKGIPILVIANKQDLPNAMSTELILKELHLDEVTDRLWYIQPACATYNTGLREAFVWLGSVLQNQVNQSTISITTITATVDAVVASDGIYSVNFFSQNSSNVESPIIPLLPLPTVPRTGKIFNTNRIPESEQIPNDIILRNEETKRRDKQRIAIIDSWIKRYINEKITDEDFLTKVTDYTLDSWDHYTHIRLGWIMLHRYRLETGFNMISEKIENFIKNSPRTNGKTFHTTMTRFWAHMIAIAICDMSTKHEIKAKDSFKYFLQRSIGIFDLWDHSLFRQYYSNQVMFSLEAKTTLVRPDIKFLPYLHWFKSLEEEIECEEKIDSSLPESEQNELRYQYNNYCRMVHLEYISLQTYWQVATNKVVL